MKRTTDGKRCKEQTIFVESHSSVSDFQHVEVIPMAMTSFLTNGSGEVDDSRHSAVWSQYRLSTLGEEDREMRTITGEFTVDHRGTWAAVIETIEILRIASLVSVAIQGERCVHLRP